jgi:hypothetical protein
MKWRAYSGVSLLFTLYSLLFTLYSLLFTLYLRTQCALHYVIINVVCSRIIAGRNGLRPYKGLRVSHRRNALRASKE